MAKDDVDKLIDDYERTVNALQKDAKANVDQSRDAWKKIKADKYGASSWAKDATQSYARSVNMWRDLVREWLK